MRPKCSEFDGLGRIPAYFTQILSQISDADGPAPRPRQDPNDPDHPEFGILGYKFYGGLVAAVLGSLLIILYRFGLFAALT